MRRNQEVAGGSHKGEATDVVRRKKHGDTFKFQDRKLSEIIKEMALRLLKKPGDPPSLAAFGTVSLLATAAWNATVGDSDLQHQHRELLKNQDWSDGEPWPELISTDTDLLITSLIDYKQAHYPNDLRLIAATRMSPTGNIQVHWRYQNKSAPAPAGAPLKKAVPTGNGLGRPIARKLVAAIKKQVHGKVVSIRDVIAGRAAAEKIQQTVTTKDTLAGLHPAHAAYVIAQNQTSVLSEQITALEEMTPFADLITKAEDMYLPSGPPMSPLTGSYFTCWAFFDAWIGTARETIGACILEVGAAFGMSQELLGVIRLMDASRMGVYLHEGCTADVVSLRDIVTGSVCSAIVPAGYRGRTGELWYARVLPPPAPGMAEHVVFTTPYVLLTPGLLEWRAYFTRVLSGTPKHAQLDAYKSHMKYGPTHRYWNEFVFEGYVNHQKEAIFLAGLPDSPESRPHSAANRRRRW
jgi:hypothetical protein